MKNQISIDLSKVAQVVNGQKIFRHAEVKDKLQKVAFDIVRFIDGSDIDGLWKIQKDDSGEYIVATYDQEKIEKEAQKKTASQWSTSIDRQDEIHVFYGSQEVKKMSSASLNLPNSAARTIAKTLEEKLASDNSFVNKFVSSLDTSVQKLLLTSHPELKNQGMQ